MNVDPEQLLSRVNGKRKLKVGLVNFVKVAQLFHGLDDIEVGPKRLRRPCFTWDLRLSGTDL